MKSYSEMTPVAQMLIDRAIVAAVNANVHRVYKEYKMMNQYLGEKDAYITAAAIADNADNPQYGEAYGIYCDRFIEACGMQAFEKIA